MIEQPQVPIGQHGQTAAVTVFTQGQVIPAPQPAPASEPNRNELIQRVAILKAISAYTKERYDEARAEAGKVMGEGDRTIARSPLDGSKLGAVYVTDPDPVCRITDQAALTEWMIERYPELTETGYEVCGSEREVIDVLFEHAPHLLRQIRRIKADDMRELRAGAVALGQPMGPGSEADMPGIVVDRPPGVVACKPVDTAWQSVADLHRAGRLQLDGTVLPAIEEA